MKSFTKNEVDVDATGSQSDAPTQTAIPSGNFTFP